MQENRCRAVLHGYSADVYGMAFTLDGTRLLSGGADSALRLWDVESSRCVRVIQGYGVSHWDLDWSPDGTCLISGSDSKGRGELFVWDVLTGECVQTFAEHSTMVYAVAWSRDQGTGPCGDQLISGGSDGRLRWWNVQSGECVSVQAAHRGMVRSLRVSPDGRWLASCGDDEAIMICDLVRNEHMRYMRLKRPYERLNITGIGELNEAEVSSLQALGAFEETASCECAP